MARIPGINANFSFNSVQIEDELSSMEMSIDVNLPEVTAFADLAAEFVEALYSATFTVSGFFDGASAQGDATIFGQIGSGEAAIVLAPTGNSPSTNDPNYQANAFVSSYSITADVAGPVSYAATFQVNGVITRAT